MPKKGKMTEKSRTKGEALVEFVLNRYGYSKSNMVERQGKWREYYDDYRGTQSSGKEPWQANYIIPSLKDVVRTKVPLYANILFSNGLKSFDILPGEEGDEAVTPMLKNILIYQLGNVGYNRRGFFNQIEDLLKQWEIYGYGATKIPWREEKDNKGRLIFDGPDIEVLDIFNLYPDPSVLDINSSWVIIKKRDVFVSTLRMLEKMKIYHDIVELKDTSQPGESSDTPALNSTIDNRVELLEYHGEIPKELLEGKIHDDSSVNPYEDEYVQALVTIANRHVCIRNVEYPYDCGNIFVDISKDRMPNEQFGVGTGEDIQGMAQELTNAHNKLCDCVNIISNPMAIINAAKIAGVSSGVIISHPGKVFTANPGVENVSNAMMFIDTRAQGAALTPLINFIRMMEEKIQKITQAVPVIASMPSKQGLPETLGATLMMQGNASEPIKHLVKHCLEPWFQKVLEIMYKHDLQFFTEESAYRVLGKEKGKLWYEDKERRMIGKEDIQMVGNPDFIPRGVSIFNEKQTEMENLINIWKVSQGAVVPKTDVMGNQIMGPDGQPQAEPIVDQREIIKRIAIKAGIDNIEELIPSLRTEREEKEIRNREKMLREKGNNPANPPGIPSIQQAPGPVPTSIPGGGVPSPAPIPQTQVMNPQIQAMMAQVGGQR